MQLEVRWDGSETPFEGNRAIPLTGIPANAQVLSARVVVTPVDPGRATSDPEDAFVERIRFTGVGPRWGANLAHGANFVEVDFRARRTLASVTVDEIVQMPAGTGASLQIDPGGTYVEINDVGAIRTPGDDLFEFLNDGEHVLPSFVVARFKITNPQANATPEITEVAVRSVPENVSLRLGDQPTFHTFLGPLTAPGTSVDFATLLTEFLQSAPVVHGQHEVSLVVHSDTIARLDVAVTLDLLLAHQPLQPGAGEAVMAFDVDALPVGAATSFQLDLPADARAVAGRTAIRFQGSFDDTRVALGPLAPAPAAAAATLIAEPSGSAPAPQAQAQPFTLTGEARNVSGVDLLLASTTAAAQVRVDIRDDQGGKPGTRSLLPAPLTLDLRQTPSTAPEWLTVTLPQPLHLEPGPTYWLVVQRALGNASWSVRPPEAGYAALQHTDDGALSWRRTSLGSLTEVEALFRLRHRPAAFTMPIHVFVGEDEARREVPLTEFEPLGRVDFVLDTEELAAAITDAVADAPARRCLPTEHLANGDLEAWFRVGDASQPPRLLPWTHSSPLAIAVAPDALYFYTLEITEGVPVLRVFDATCRTEQAVLSLSMPDDDDLFPGGLAAAPAGRLLFASLGRHVWVIDLQARGEVGRWAETRPVAALAAGGGRLLVARASTDGESADIRRIETTVARVAAADGQTPVGTFITALEATPRSIATTPGGERIMVAYELDTAPASGRLVVHEAAGPVRFDLDLAFRPTGVALSSRGARALVGDASGNLLRPVDLERRTVGSGIAPGVDPRHLGLAAIAGDRAVAFGFGAFEQRFVSVVDFGTPVPRHWQITAGLVRPVCLGDPFHVAARLGEVGTEVAAPLSALSQVVAVSGGCSYDFSFWGVASSDGAAGEVIWRGGGCEGTRTDTVPIVAAPPTIGTKAAAPALVLHRARLEAPADASQAEVRFRAADGMSAVVDVASLRPPDGPLDNPDLRQMTEEGLPHGWTLEPPGTAAFQFADGVVTNLGGGPIVLAQEVEVTADDPFALEFRGGLRAEGDLPVLAVHWIDADEPPVALELGVSTDVVRVADGVVPAGATRAEVSLTLPGGSEVDVTHLALRTRVLTGVPISVFAEAPGTLTISRFQVVTDSVPPAPPDPPPQGLCPATSPGDECVDEAGEDHYCPSCRSKQRMRRGRDAVIDGRPVQVVTCDTCTATQVRSGSGAVGPRRPLALPSLAIAPRRGLHLTAETGLAANGVHAPLVSHRPSPLVAIRGISQAEVVSLTHAGVIRPAQLVALDPERLAALLPSTSLTRARLLQGLARKVIEEG